MCQLGSSDSILESLTVPIAGSSPIFEGSFGLFLRTAAEFLKIWSLMDAINRPFYVKGHFLNTWSSVGCVKFWQVLPQWERLGGRPNVPLTSLLNCGGDSPLAPGFME